MSETDRAHLYYRRDFQPISGNYNYLKSDNDASLMQEDKSHAMSDFAGIIRRVGTPNTLTIPRLRHRVKNSTLAVYAN